MSPRPVGLLKAGEKVRVRRGTSPWLDNRIGVVVPGLTSSSFYTFVRLVGDKTATMVRRDEIRLVSAVERLADLA